jgi:phospholipase C
MSKRSVFSSLWLHKYASLPFVLVLLGVSVTHRAAARDGDDSVQTKTPIKHVVVIFQENRSFDQYFATYPHAANLPGETPFHATDDTARVNGLLTAGLLEANPNSSQPQRLSPANAIVCSDSHDYTDEQNAFDHGLMDMFPERTASSGCPLGQVVDYFDGNTVTALWNYAQHFAMSDNSFNTTFGPSSPGAVNLISGQTHGIAASLGDISGDVVDGTLIGDADPLYDDCGSPDQVGLSGRNIGDLLNAKGVTWGWFEGGFSNCNATHTTTNGGVRKDYIPHHQPFQYYASTANRHHLPPTSVALIGHKGDQANQQYDITNFWQAADAGNLPAVSFIKAPAYQDGNAGYSNPLLEQQFVVSFINRLERLPEWSRTAVFLAWDDSGGWYDHVMSPIINQSQTARDALTGPGLCGSNTAKVAGGYQARCGYGTRLPFLVISPWAKQNYVDHNVTDQTSIIHFIEDNWDTGRIGDYSFDALSGSLRGFFDSDDEHRNARRLFLNPSTGLAEDDGDRDR